MSVFYLPDQCLVINVITNFSTC